MGRQQGERAIRIEAQQMLQGDTYGCPGRDEHEPVIGHQEQVDTSQDSGEHTYIAALADFPLQIAGRKRANYRAKQLYQQS